MKNVSIIGGGAAGFFAAIHIAELRPDLTVTLYEKSPQVLSKVRISGGGRCNVTHHCFESKDLVKFYPRGEKQLIGPFTQFGPADTVKWFELRGVKLKTEADGRMFPVSDSSETIIECLLNAAINAGVKIQTKKGIESFVPVENGAGGWELKFSDHEKETTDALIIATGSSDLIWKQIEKLDIKTESGVPSLFTFNIKDDRLKDLLGISFPSARAKVLNTKLISEGPMLITHWGLSGPGILKISAWGARILNELNYKFRLSVNFLPEENEESVFNQLNQLKTEHQRKLVHGFSPFEAISKRFWIRLCETSAITSAQNWADVNKQQLRKLATELTAGIYEVNGKSTFKDEFVTCGGISLSEIDFKTMSAKKYNNLFFAGEVMDIDAITGGFNFQNAWTSGWIAATAIAKL